MTFKVPINSGRIRTRPKCGAAVDGMYALEWPPQRGGFSSPCGSMWPRPTRIGVPRMMCCLHPSVGHPCQGNFVNHPHPRLLRATKQGLLTAHFLQVRTAPATVERPVVPTKRRWKVDCSPDDEASNIQTTIEADCVGARAEIRQQRAKFYPLGPRFVHVVQALSNFGPDPVASARHVADAWPESASSGMIFAEHFQNCWLEDLHER